ncbi:unnamed protein product, partial [Closterium sp. NIES-54]
CPPVPFPGSSLASLQTHPGGSSTTPPRVGPAPSGVSQVDPAKPVEVAVNSGAESGGAEPAGAGTGGAESGGAESGRAEPGGAKPGRVEPEGTVSGGAEPARARSGGVLGVPPRWEPLSPQQLPSGGAAGAGAAGGAAGAGAAGGGGGVAGLGAAGGVAGLGATGGAAGTGDPGAEGTGSVSAVFGGVVRPRPYYVPLLQQSASVSVCPPSVGGECALGTDVLEDRQEEFECFAASVPHLVSMLLAPEGDPDAPDIPTPRSYAEAIEGPYSSQWQTAMEMAS